MQAGVLAPPGHCFPARRGAAIARHARGEWGVRQCPCPVSRSRSALRRASPAGQLPRTQNEPMLRKGNVPVCMSRQVVRRTACLLQTGVLEPYVEHGKQALRSPGARIACFDRRVVRHAGWEQVLSVSSACNPAFVPVMKTGLRNAAAADDHTRTSLRTFPCTSVRLTSRPPKRKVSFWWSSPS